MEVWEKSQTVDPEVRAYVYSLVNAVGGQSTLEERYEIGDDALAVLHDLTRWLKLYDEKTNRYDVKRCLAEANLVRGDLLEILALWPEEEQESKLKAKLALAGLQLLVPLTWPIEMEEEKTTVNHLRHTPYLQLAQVGYKRAVLHYEDAKVLRTAIRVGLSGMAVERRARSRRDEGIIKLVLYFLRNVVMIVQPQNLPSQGDENEVSRSATIEAFREQDVFSLLLTVASGAGDEFQDQDVIILETLFHLLKGVDAKKLFMQKEQLDTEETNELQSLMQKEKAMLNSYNKHAPTRHNRFGTMIWVKREDHKVSTVPGQNSITNASTTLHGMDASKKFNKPKPRGKFTKEELKENVDFSPRVDLTENARKHLRIFIEHFVDSSFNPLFSSLRKAIEREANRIDPNGVLQRQYFYLISWFLNAESARRDRNTARQTSSEDNTFAYIAGVLDQETFVLLTRQMQSAFDEKRWQDLNAIILAFTQILLTVQSMSESKDEEDQEIAENIQNRIFYEESTQDLVVQILRNYDGKKSGQGLSYLDAVTECVHVFVRMLERYSKVNVDLQIRSKRRARRKKKKRQSQPQQSSNPDSGEGEGQDNDAEDDAAEEQEIHRAANERKFDFTRFSAKFLTQPCVNTFISLLHFYADLSPQQRKRCHRYLYRLAFKHELAVMLFRVDILQLLHKIIEGPNGLDGVIGKSDDWKEWEQLVRQVFRRCIKWIERESEGEGWREAAVTEMLFSKIPGTVFYLQNGYERVVEKRAPRPPAELAVKASVEDEKKVGVVVSMLLEQGKGEDLEWVKGQLKNASEERQAWEDERAAKSSVEKEAEDGEVPGMEATVVPAPLIFLSADNDERKAALFKDKYLRLLLTTLGLERLGEAEDVDASWIFPSQLSAAQLNKALEQIKRTEFDGLSLEDGETIQDLIRNKSSATRRAEPSPEDSGSDRDVDEPPFPLNQRQKRGNVLDDEDRPKKKRRLTRRNRTELTDEEAKKRAEEKKERARERNRKIKSELLVVESDDEEGDEEFYRLEAERRTKMADVIQDQLRREAGEDNSGGGKMISASTESPVPLEAPIDISTDQESSVLGASDDEEGNESPADPHEQEHEEIPSTSQPGESFPLAEVSGNAALGKNGALQKGTQIAQEEDEDEDEDDMPVMKAPVHRRNLRAGFVLDDSDSE